VHKWDFYMGGYKVIVQFKGLVTSRSGCCDYKFGKLWMGWVFLVQTDRQTDRQINRKIDRQRDRHSGRQADDQTDSDRQQTDDSKTDRHRE
jgi:hypothetical protein